MIAAAPGWRVVLWSREQDDVVGLPIVAWEAHEYETQGGVTYQNMRPWFLTEDFIGVVPLRDSDLLVGILPPGDELHGWEEAGRAVAQAEDEAEERRIRQAREAEARAEGHDPDLSLRPRPGETPDDVISRVTAASRAEPT